MKAPDIGRKFKRTLLTGFLVITPVGVTFLVLKWLVSTADSLLAPVSVSLIGHHVPGLGLFTALFLFLGVGFLGSNIAGRHILEALEEGLLLIPGFNWLYRTIKQLTEVFAPEGKPRFRSVVLVEYPQPGFLRLGFVTNRLHFNRGGKSEERICVYVPTNHLYIGDMILLPGKKVFQTGLTLQEGIQCILSAGASLSDLPRPSPSQNRRSGT